jgi:hypothetical protein
MPELAASGDRADRIACMPSVSRAQLTGEGDMKIASHWRLLMVAIGLAAAGCSGAEPADSKIDERTSREVSERLKKAVGEGPQSLVCGDGKCKQGEDCSNCSADCGACGACSHDICIAGPALDESCDTCAADICAVDPFCCDAFWDGLCVSEVASVCGQTCPSVCGDNKCEGKEDCKSCASDCGTCDKKCHDECVTGDPLSTNCSKCAEDICAVDPYCCNVYWDGICVSEVDQYCKKGCGNKPKCGDGLCDASAGESCSSCSADCGACPTCGDGVCDPASENCQICAVDCGSCGGSCDHDKCTTGGPLNATCDKCTDAICQVDSFCCTTQWDSICVSEVQSVCGDSSCGTAICGNGLCEFPEDASTCPVDCSPSPGPTCGDAKCDPAIGEDCSTCAADCGSCGGSCDHDKCKEGGPLAASCDKCVDAICQVDSFCCDQFWDDICVGEVQSVCGDPSCDGALCGNGTCAVPEDCQSCPADCGSCPVCGDGKCAAADFAEDCSSCPADCGICAVCGDGKCDPVEGEDCSTCAADCGGCGGTCSHDQCTSGGPLDASCGTCVDTICQADPFCCTSAWDSICISEVGSLCGETCTAGCGDSICDASLGENCSTCVADCGGCPVPVCGDAKCDPAVGEDCSTCAADCGTCGGTCAHDICVTGKPLDANCDKCAAAICAVDSFCCNSMWDSICVSEVQSVCGQTCSP